MNCKKNVSIEPLRLSITEGTGVEKSHSMNIFCMFLIKTMNIHSVTPHKAKVLILAPPRVAVNNIYGATINSGLSISQYVMDILYQGFHIQKEQDYAICILM